MHKHILLLGGSSEAFELAQNLNDHPHFKVTSSLAGRTSLPRKPVGHLRTGGFGGAKGLASYLTNNNIDAIIDATHPFASKISANAQLAATAINCPLIHLWRPPWQKTTGDHWIDVPTMQAAAACLMPEHSPIFLTIGRLELGSFLTRPDLSFLTRAIEPPKSSDPIKSDPTTQQPLEKWPDNFKFIYAKGPFTYKAEEALIKQHNIKAIVTKNSGGDKASAKLEVARALHLPVIMISRPQKPKGPTASTTTEALTWLATTFHINEINS